MTKSSRPMRVAAAVVALVLVSSASRADYRLQAGDVIETAVAGLPDLRQRSTVGLDGEVSVPMIAPLKVSGLNLSEAEALIKERLSRKLYQQRTPDGRESVTAIAPDAVLVTVAEYRPIYLNGDVTKPGQQTYRPGMTVRQAISLAGGYEIMRFRMNNPFLETADLRNEHQTLWMQFVTQQALIWRLEAQLNSTGPAALDRSLEAATQGPVSAPFLQSVRASARGQLNIAVDRAQAERVFLQKAVKTADDQIALLRSRQEKEEESVKADVADYDKLKEFSRSGNLPMTRLSEARRLSMFSATQSLATSVQFTATVRERDEALRKVARLDETLRADMLKQVEAATLERDGIRSRLAAAGEKIAYTGMIRSQLNRKGGPAPTITITRPEADGGGTVTADENAPVRPGDTVDVALHTEVPEVSQ
ncbi:polysaccharide biosynthesis/export family protein [uncultured Enterovirga sp.]|uniref:polysaccharide biosynthesis/export family protein n=1 Tax=uncultured Enterovirga sp. TaxID=2026352 RepID=UPI0035C976A0